ncbi:hypothetical protein D3C76_1445740 [compost metagenome]
MLQEFQNRDQVLTDFEAPHPTGKRRDQKARDHEQGKENDSHDQMAKELTNDAKIFFHRFNSGLRRS